MLQGVDDDDVDELLDVVLFSGAALRLVVVLADVAAVHWPAVCKVGVVGVCADGVSVHGIH